MAIGRMKVWLSKVPILSLGRLKVDDCLEGKECDSKVDGPSSEIPTQSNKMKVQSGGMADLGPASSKYIYEVGEVERSFDEIEGDFDEASVDGVVRDVFVFENGEGGNIFSGHDRPIKRIERMKNHLVKSQGMTTRHLKATAMILIEVSGRKT
ncbi:hypothetical protein LWI29_038506 [Acer saccharum]|uniref:Uncharacterized protein n=1 Tax=Acer saccharum TaxID=4024 RepID=A0AA39VBF1_ACESA|nr:hypothetical protein LWI29_038506 [Acer saccharum]